MNPQLARLAEPQGNQLRALRTLVTQHCEQLILCRHWYTYLKGVFERQGAPPSDIAVVNDQISEFDDSIDLWNQRRVEVNDTIATIPRVEREKFHLEPLEADIPDGNWQYTASLGGGISRAGIWVRLDQHGNITDVSYLTPHRQTEAEADPCVPSVLSRRASTWMKPDGLIHKSGTAMPQTSTIAFQWNSGYSKSAFKHRQTISFKCAGGLRIATN